VTSAVRLDCFCHTTAAVLGWCGGGWVSARQRVRH